MHLKQPRPAADSSEPRGSAGPRRPSHNGYYVKLSFFMESPLFNWLDQRGAGVLLHPTALPSEYGIGAFDEAAFAFLEFLAKAEFKYWQLCPLGPTGYGDSPYQCFSAFAGNPYLIDPVALVSAGLLSADAIAPLRALGPDRVD